MTALDTHAALKAAALDVIGAFATYEQALRAADAAASAGAYIALRDRMAALGAAVGSA